MPRLLAMLFAVGLFTLATPTAQADDTAFVRTIRLPAGQLCPQTAVDADGHVHLVYFTGDPRHGDLFHARSDDGGRTFAGARRVNGRPGTVVVIGSVRGPQLAVGRGGRLHVSWTAPVVGQGPAGGLAMCYARSGTAGDGFAPERDVTTDHPGVDGGGSVAADADGNVYLAWHAPDERGGTEADRRVWLARSTDDGATFAAATAVGPAHVGACGCCGLRVAAGAGGRVGLVFRSATDAVHRDTYVLRSDDHAATFGVGATDAWQASTCVMSTAALTLANGHDLAAWETRGQIFVLTSDAARANAVLVSGPGRVCKHPAVAVNGRGEFCVAWAEGTGWERGGSVAWQAFGAGGHPLPGQSGRAAGLPTWSAPSVVATADDGFTIVY